MLKLIFRLQCSFHTKRRCGTNYKAQPMCSNMFSHILLMRPSLIVQHFLQKYWFAVLALSACVPGAVAVMKRLHRKALEIPSASSRTLISKQRHTARERTCSLGLYLGKDSPTPFRHGGSASWVAAGRLLISHWAVWGTPGWSCWTRKAKTALGKSCLAHSRYLCSTAGTVYKGITKRRKFPTGNFYSVFIINLYCEFAYVIPSHFCSFNQFPGSEIITLCLCSQEVRMALLDYRR